MQMHVIDTLCTWHGTVRVVHNIVRINSINGSESLRLILGNSNNSLDDN